MQVNNLHNSENTDLLNTIKKQHEEIEILKAKVKDLECKLNQSETETISEVLLKVNKILKEAEQSLFRIHQVQAEAEKHLKKLNSDNISEFGSDVQKLTNDKNLEDTDVDNKNEVIDTEEKSQTKTDIAKGNNVTEEKMLIPLNTSLTIIRPKFLKKIVDKRKIKLLFIYTISFLIVVFSLFQIIRLKQQKNVTIELTTELQSYITEVTDAIEQEQSNITYKVDFEGLSKINSDTVGWIKVNGVGVDFPVVHSNDNTFYLKHSFDKSYNVCGWIYADYRNKLDGTDKNVIIYGHNRKDGTMFSPMINILNPNLYDKEENRYVTFITKEGEVTYEIFSVYQIKVEDYYIKTQFSSDEEYENFLNTLKSRSVKDFNIDLAAKDQILTLSTCGKENKYRVVLHAKKL